MLVRKPEFVKHFKELFTDERITSRQKQTFTGPNQIPFPVICTCRMQHLHGNLQTMGMGNLRVLYDKA